MKRYVKKLNKEVDFSQIQVHTELYEVLRDIKYQGKFKTFNETISWLVRSTNILLSKKENREMLIKEQGE